MNWSRSWQDALGAIETTVRGLGYELVDAERSVGGLLRVTIDHAVPVAPAAAGTASAPEEAGITVDDCEKVTRQLQHVLEVEGVDYQRLEVSSPGLDRPLRRPADYARFAGREVDLTLKLPFQGRKRWRGELQANGDAWRLVLPVEGGKAAEDAPAPRALDFAFGEVREARLVPVIDFKRRRGSEQGGAPVDGKAEEEAKKEAEEHRGRSKRTAPGAAEGRTERRKGRAAPARAIARDGRHGRAALVPGDARRG